VAAFQGSVQELQYDADGNLEQIILIEKTKDGTTQHIIKVKKIAKRNEDRLEKAAEEGRQVTVVTGANDDVTRIAVWY
jgi:hypothetical protein